MTDRLDHFRSELDSAAQRIAAGSQPTTGAVARRRSWGIKRPAVALVVVAVVAGGTTLATGIDSGRTDPLAAAAAALDPGSSVVHIVLEGGPTDTDGTAAPSQLSFDGTTPSARIGRRIEQWSASGPLRFRSEQRATTEDGRPLGTISNGITADGTVWNDLSWDGKPADTQTSKSAAPYGDIADVGAFGTTDPAGMIRQQLRAGRFQVGRTTRVAGHDAIELVSTSTRQRGTREAPSVIERLVYLADAESYAPLELKTYERFSGSMVPERRQAFELRSVLRIVSYERVDADDVPVATFRVPPR